MRDTIFEPCCSATARERKAGEGLTEAITSRFLVVPVLQNKITVLSFLYIFSFFMNKLLIGPRLSRIKKELR